MLVMRNRVFVNTFISPRSTRIAQMGAAAYATTIKGCGGLPQGCRADYPVLLHALLGRSPFFTCRSKISGAYRREFTTPLALNWPWI